MGRSELMFTLRAHIASGLAGEQQRDKVSGVIPRALDAKACGSSPAPYTVDRYEHAEVEVLHVLLGAGIVQQLQEHEHLRMPIHRRWALVFGCFESFTRTLVLISATGLPPNILHCMIRQHMGSWT